MKAWARAMALAVIVATTFGAASAQRGNSLAFQRAEHLRRGINLSIWYAQTKDFSATRLDNFVTKDDFEIIKNLGFDHVRLSIDPEWLIAEPQSGALKREPIARIDRTVKELNDFGLAVVLDIQPEDSFKAPLARGDDSAARFCDFWSAFAAHFAATDPSLVFFEIMNEPTMEDLYRWEGLQDRAVARIRAVAPRHTILATSSQYSKIDSLLALEPVRDENVIYTFHEYDPMWFTHQGANWGTQAWVHLHGVPYPSTPENIKAVLDQERDERIRLWLQRYGLERWDASRLTAEISTMADWAQRRGVPLYCGEFGVFKNYSDPQARAAWITDVRTALEARHIGWAMWEYQDSFGLVTKGPSGTVVDPAIATALGLKKN
jgi:endoglucanase